MASENDIDEMLLHKQAAEHLKKIGYYLSSSNSPASRSYMTNVEKHCHGNPYLLNNSIKLSYEYCHHCGSIWSPENCRVQIQKRPSVNSHLKKLLQLEANEPWRLNNRQKKKLRKCRDSTNKLVYNCFSCKKKTIYPGSKKSDLKCKPALQPSSSTPKIKLKKGSLNAGLFISSPVTPDTNQSNIEKSEISKIKECKTPAGIKVKNQSESGSHETKEKKSKILNTSYQEIKVTPKTVKSLPELNISNEGKQSSSKKRKKTLLAQILNQEQNKKKKPGLSSFLLSL